ncbi:MAG: 3-deoxy-7-phosphoheptulonate synthase [Spirochaetes bacterium]|nr:3-deoxy-7-phosphoheptulonate synthase [Spirochaetota bacterium]
MSFEYKRKIPTPEEILKEMPLSSDLYHKKLARDKEIKNIITGQKDQFLVIVGPCSAHNVDAVAEYVSKLASLQDQVHEKLVLVPRIYTNKPRTTGVGYKGMMHQPDPQKQPNIVEGLKAIRRMHLRILQESGLSAADEMLYPGNYPYLEDLLSYVAVGARSVENQQHRLTVSGLDVPIGMKNPTSGDITVMLNSIEAAQQEHVFIYNGWEVETPGNPLVHAILRGALNRYGRHIPNYHYEDLIRLADMYQERCLSHPVVIVDTNHSNSSKQFDQQPRIAMEILYSRKKSSTIKEMVKGLIIESYLLPGSQPVTGTVFGQSITDPCLGWAETENLILEIADYV